jgi:wobble nucleotide-excising tRNase
MIKKDDTYEKAESEIKNYISLIKDKKEFISKIREKILFRADDAIEDIKSALDTRLTSIFNSAQAYETLLDDISKQLMAKQNNMDTEILLNDNEAIVAFKNSINDLNETIIKNNEAVQNIETEKEVSKQIVITYYVLENKVEIETLKSETSELISKEEETKNRVKEIDEEIIKLNTELDNQQAPLDEIEKYISIVFSESVFKFEYDSVSKSYVIKRKDGSIAKHLSEGEKTVVAFAYFLATLKSKDFDLKNSIIVIDDPVSSLDQRYLFNLINLLYNVFKSTKEFGQLFVLTHNYYFYKKIRNILQNKEKSGNDQRERRIQEILEILKREDNETKKQKFNEEFKTQKEKITILTILEIYKNDNGCSNLINANKYLKNYQSEYLHVVDYLKNKYNTISNEDDNDLQIGNSIRKVLEIFLSFRHPNEKTITTRFMKAIDNIPNTEAPTYKYLEDIANASSHTDESADLSVLEEFKLFVGKQEIEQLFKFIELIDPEHHKALKLPVISA